MNETKCKSVLEKLFEFQQENVQIIRTREAYGYNYAPLDVIIPLILPLLKKYRLGYYHITEYDATTKSSTLKTVIYNVDNTEDSISSVSLIDNSVALAKMNKFMVEGSAITYFRRYHLVDMLGLVTEEDSDVGGAKIKRNRNTVEDAPADNTTNFVTIFQGLINKGKTQAILEKMLDQYKAQIKPEDVSSIEQLIKTKFTTV